VKIKNNKRESGQCLTLAGERNTVVVAEGNDRILGVREVVGVEYYE